MINHDNITLGTSRKYSFGLIWTHLGLLRPLEANSRNESYVWHIGAGSKHQTAPEVINHDNITMGTSRNTHLGLWRPPEAKPNTMVRNKVVYDILEQVGSVQQAQKSHFTIMSLWGHPENSDLGLCGPLKDSRDQTKHTMVGI